MPSCLSFDCLIKGEIGHYPISTLLSPDMCKTVLESTMGRVGIRIRSSGPLKASSVVGINNLLV